MSEQSNKTLIIGLVAVAVLLAAAVGVIAYQQSQRLPEPSAAPTTAPPATGAPAAGNPAAGAPSAPADVDPKAATKVPKGTEPEDFVKGYYDACQKGDWQKAYDSLPADTKAGTNPESLQQQVSGYGVKEFAVTGAKVEGDQAFVKVDQVTSNYGTFENTWTFVKKDGAWFLTGKSVTGMK